MFSPLFLFHFHHFLVNRIFVEKIKEHPEYNTLSPPERSQFNSKLKLEVFPKTETLKQELLKLFQREHEQYLDEMVWWLSVFFYYTFYHLSIFQEKIKQQEMIRMQQEMEALQIQRENEERQKLLNAEKQRLIEEGKKQNNQSVLRPTTSIVASAPALYPVDNVPSFTPTENKTTAASG